MTGSGAILEALPRRRTIEPKVMIVVAHPDDETIGMGAQLCRFSEVLLVQVTDGAPRDGRDAAAHGYATIEAYAYARHVELCAALEAGQAYGVTTEVIGVADQEACFNLVRLVRLIAARAIAYQPEAVFVQPYEGGHPDHDAASFITRAACRLVEAAGHRAPEIIEMAAYHANGAGLATGVFLTTAGPVTILPLSAAERERKALMIKRFASQRELLAGFDLQVERFRAAPDYDFSRPPHQGTLHYERLGWSITGGLWRDHAQAALATLGLGAAG